VPIRFSNAGFVQGSDEFGIRLSVYLLVNVYSNMNFLESALVSSMISNFALFHARLWNI